MSPPVPEHTKSTTRRTNIDECVGKIISEHPFVKILAKPVLQEYELLPGLIVRRWEALAQVNEALVIVELKVTE
jgi:hypothetical protein